MKKNLLLFVLLVSVSIASAQPPPASKPPESSLPIPAMVVVKPGRYTFNNTEAGAPKNTSTTATSSANVPIVEEIPPEVLVNGKPVSQLSDEEKQKFLQNKIKRIRQSDLEVKLVRIAPGYPVTFDFSEPVKNFSLGDAKLASVQSVSPKEMLLTALSRPPGDTSFQVVTKDEKRFIYHVFLAENFVDADLVICVNKECAWMCWLKWIVVIGILAALAYIFREKIRNFKLVKAII